MAIITITLHIDPDDPSKINVSYDPNNKVEPHDDVVFTVRGSTDVFTVTFPEGSIFESSASSIKVGGSTLAEQSSSQEKVARMPLAHYRFVVVPEKNTTSGGSVLDSPGTTAGDLEVVPDTGGGDPGRSVEVMPFPEPLPEPVPGEPVFEEVTLPEPVPGEPVLEPLPEPVLGEPVLEEAPPKPSGGDPQ